ncbi:MAG: nucleotidyltransferase domain-containing protein [Micromonosporaceae bacterium]
MSAPVETTAPAVGEFLDLMESLGVRVWLDGGWAVDACLGVQTRRHGDLDIVIEERDTPRVVQALWVRGYRPVLRDDSCAWNFVLGHENGRQVDFHVIVLDTHGDGIYGPPQNGQRYPAEALAGTGDIDGRGVACITPQWLVAFHTGYAVDATDWADVSALCDRFGIPIPDDYLPFR